MKVQKLLMATLFAASVAGCQQESVTSTQTEGGATSPQAPKIAELPVSSSASVVATVSEVNAVEAAVSAVTASISPPIASKNESLNKTVSSAKSVVKAVASGPAEGKVATATTVAPVVSVAKPDVKVPETKVLEAVLSEAEGLALAKKNNCLNCHAIDKKVVGPAWKDVANKYRGDATAEAHLVSKIATGGKGVWGSMAMPAHPQISEADRKSLAKFVLSLK